MSRGRRRWTGGEVEIHDAVGDAFADDEDEVRVEEERSGDAVPVAEPELHEEGERAEVERYAEDEVSDGSEVAHAEGELADEWELDEDEAAYEEAYQEAYDEANQEAYDEAYDEAYEEARQDEPTGTPLRSPWAKLAIVVVALGLLAVEAFILFGGSGTDPDAPQQRSNRDGPGEPPAELPAVGAYVRSEILESGRIEVQQWIRSATPLTSLLLAAHDAPLPADTAQARDLDVVTGAGRVVVSDTVVGATPTRVDLGGPTKLVRLTYELTGVVDRAGSVTGRALAGVTFLDVDYLPQTGPARVLVSGSSVLNLSCADRASETALRRPCGAPRGSGWQVTLAGPERDDRVAAQLDLG